MADVIGFVIQIVKWLTIIAFCAALVALVVAFSQGGGLMQEGVAGLRNPSALPNGDGVSAARWALSLFSSGVFNVKDSLLAYVALAVSAVVALAGWRVSKWFTDA